MYFWVGIGPLAVKMGDTLCLFLLFGVVLQNDFIVPPTTYLHAYPHFAVIFKVETFYIQWCAFEKTLAFSSFPFFLIFTEFTSKPFVHLLPSQIFCKIGLTLEM